MTRMGKILQEAKGIELVQKDGDPSEILLRRKSDGASIGSLSASKIGLEWVVTLGRNPADQALAARLAPVWRRG